MLVKLSEEKYTHDKILDEQNSIQCGNDISSLGLCQEKDLKQLQKT